MLREEISVRTAPRGGSFEYQDMSQQAAISGPLPVSQDNIPSNQIPANQPLPISLPIVIGIAGMFLFILSQMLVVAGAAVWAIGGYFHFHLLGFAVLAAIACLPVGFGSWKVLRMAIEAERDPANN